MTPLIPQFYAGQVPGEESADADGGFIKKIKKIPGACPAQVAGFGGACLRQVN